MTLTVEDGTGVAGSESYATTAYIDSYWAARPHRAEAATWDQARLNDKEGAAREATAYLDGTYGPHYRGKRAGYVQGLLWPRIEARDAMGELLPGLPPELQIAVAELSARALSAVLQADLDRGGYVMSESKQVDTIRKSVTYSSLAPVGKRYGVIDGLLAEILDGSQPNAPGNAWAWA